MSRHISLLVPGLLAGGGMAAFDGDPVMSAGDVGALEWLLTLAECQQLAETDTPALVWQQAGQTGPVPAAALSYIHDFGELPRSPVLRADPVYLEADRDCVRMLSAEVADLELDQARQLIAEINAQFSDEPWRLVPGTAQRWYLLLDKDAAIVTQAPESVLGANIHDYMPVGEGQRYWRSIINEIQMLMFSSPVNQRRQEEGRIPASSLWLWGEGDAPSLLSLPWAALYSSAPVVAGLGLQGGLPVAKAPLTAQKLLDMAPPTGHILCQPVLPGAQSDLVAFNHDWVLPLYKALQCGMFGSRSKRQLDSVELLPANGVSYRLSPGKWQWWRQRRRIDSFLE